MGEGVVAAEAEDDVVADGDHQADLQALVHHLRDGPGGVALLEVVGVEPAYAARTAVDQAPSEA